MAYKGNELHNSYENEIVLEWFEAKNSLPEIAGLASKQDLNLLIYQLTEVFEQHSNSLIKTIAARTVFDWVENISVPTAISNEGDSILPPKIEWLINRIVQDQRTSLISLVNKNNCYEIWVCAEGDDGDTQYEYSGYLIEAMDKFGYFAADIIVYSPHSLECAYPPSGAIKIYPRGE